MGIRRFVNLFLMLLPVLAVFSSCDGGTQPPVPPTAAAGPDQSVNLGQVVQLNGTGSSDPKNKTLTYSWSFLSRPGGSAATLSGATSAAASFTPDVGGQYVVQLTVDNGKLTGTDDCTITVNGPPVADAGSDQTVTAGESVQLDGGGSSDPEGSNLTYSWSFQSRPAGSNASLSDPAAERPTFTADKGGEYVVRLVVNDGALNSTPDDCTISANTPPVANAGLDQTTRVDKFVQLDGSGSTDADGDPLSYTWAFTSRPDFSSAALANSNTVNPGFTPDRTGDYVVSLAISDGKDTSDPDYVTITALPNLPPDAEAGADQAVAVNAIVQLNGSGSSDPNNDPLTYAWSFVSRPAGSAAILANANTVSPFFNADVWGTFIVRLTVSDGSLTDSDEVSITAGTFITPGQYAGNTNQGGDVSFAVSGDGNSVTGFEIEYGALPPCAGTLTVTWVIPLPLANGQFAFSDATNIITGEATSSTSFSGTGWKDMSSWGCPNVNVTWIATRTGPAPATSAAQEAAKARAEGEVMLTVRRIGGGR